jgi:hypothetical protein
MSKSKHWHWFLIVGVFVAASLYVSRSAALGLL